MKVAIGNDHAAVALKNEIMEYVQSLGHEVVNFGSDGKKPIYKVETGGTLPIYCTQNHPFYVRQKNKIWY